MAMCQLISCTVYIFLGLTELNLCVSVSMDISSISNLKDI